MDLVAGLQAAAGVGSALEGFLRSAGPFAVFMLLMLSGVGIPLGEDLVTIPAGALIAGGRLDLWPTLAAAYVGIVCADTLWFVICSRYGTRLLHGRWFKRLVHPRRLLEAKHQLDRRGVGFIVMARFIPSSRTAAITVAGSFGMPLWKFVAATAPCVLVTVPMQVGLGYLIGRGIETEDTAQLILRMMGLVMLIAAVLAVMSIWTRHRLSKKRSPRAKAKWLGKFRRRREEPEKSSTRETTSVTSS